MKFFLQKSILIAFLCCIGTANAQAPANDLCANATNLPLTNICVNGTNIAATRDSNTRNSSNELGVWYTFVATTSYTRFTAVTMSNIDVGIALFSSCSNTPFVYLDNNYAGQVETGVFNTTIGSTYKLLVYGYNSSVGAFCIKAQSLTTPSDDICSNAIALNIGSSCVGGYTHDASVDASYSYNCGSGNPKKGVWYSFVATSAITKTTLTTSTITFDPILALYTSCSSTAAIKCEDSKIAAEGEELVANTVIGNTYWVLVDGYDTTGGDFCIKAEAFIPPANDICMNATSITINTACTNGTNGYSTADTATFSCTGTEATENSVWYSFVATNDTAIISVTGLGGFDPAIAVFGACTNDVSLGCSDNTGSSGVESIYLSVMAGTTYYVMVDGYGNGQGNFCIQVRTPAAPPANDNIANATPITVNSNCTEGNLLDITLNTWEDTVTLNGCGGLKAAIWYSFVATSTNTKITLAGNFDKVLTLFNSSYRNITCEDNTGVSASEIAILPTVIGQTYYIGVNSYYATTPSDTFCVKVEAITPITNDACANATPLTLNLACSNGNTVGAVTDIVSTNCGSATTPLGGNVWYSFTATDSTTFIETTADFDIILNLHTNCTTTPIACKDDVAGNESLAASTTIGQMYYVSVNGYNGSQGTFCINAFSNIVIGIKDATNSNISISPNPTTDVLNVTIPSLSTTTTLEIWTIDGKLVQTMHPTTSSTAIPVASLTNGLYIVKVKELNTTTIRKFIKQ